MTSGPGPYLVAATACQAAFALGYWLLLARLTTFGLNRAYLLAALLLSVALPLLPLPAAWAAWLGPAPAPGAGLPAWKPGLLAPAAGSPAAAPAWHWQWPPLLAAYWLGVAWQVVRTARSLGSLYRLARRHPRTRQGGSWVVQLAEPGWPAFSFGRYVFLGPSHALLSSTEQRQLLAHERVHGQQYHSLDVLLVEVLGWFFWFNGLVRYLGRQLRTVHEYLADAAVAPEASSRNTYGRLLLKLAAAPPAHPYLTHPFATSRVALRIQMLTTSPSSTLQKMRFLLVLPLAAAAWAGTTLLASRPAAAATTLPATNALVKSRIGTITWRGNTFLTTAQLGEALALKPGDAYTKQALSAQLNRLDEGSVTSRYLDQGYLFFQLDPLVQPQADGTTNLVFVLHEGRPARLGTISLAGTKQGPTADILARLPLRSGDLFSRAKLLEAQRVLAQDGRFDAQHINVNPQPVPRPGEATDLVNIALVVTER